jgi:hypothetical protein
MKREVRERDKNKERERKRDKEREIRREREEREIAREKERCIQREGREIERKERERGEREREGERKGITSSPAHFFQVQVLKTWCLSLKGNTQGTPETGALLVLILRKKTRVRKSFCFFLERPVSKNP